MAASTFVQIYELGGVFTFALVTEPDVSASPTYTTLEAAIAAAIAANPGIVLRRPDGSLITQDAAGDMLTQ